MKVQFNGLQPSWVTPALSEVSKNLRPTTPGPCSQRQSGEVGSDEPFQAKSEFYCVNINVKMCANCCWCLCCPCLAWSWLCCPLVEPCDCWLDFWDYWILCCEGPLPSSMRQARVNNQVDQLVKQSRRTAREQIVVAGFRGKSALIAALVGKWSDGGAPAERHGRDAKCKVALTLAMIARFGFRTPRDVASCCFDTRCACGQKLLPTCTRPR